MFRTRFVAPRTLSAAAAAIVPAVRYASTTPRIYRSSRPSVMHLVEKETSLYDCMMKRMEPKSNEIAFICGETGRKVTFDAFKLQCDHYARELYHVYKVRRNTMVLLCSPNVPEFGSVMYGIFRCGGVLSPINPLSTPEMMATQAEQSGARLIATTHDFARVAEAAAELVKKSTGEEVRVWVFDKPNQCTDAIPQSGLDAAQTGPDDVIMLPFSSGTTGRAKGVMLTNYSIVANMYQVADYMTDEEPVVNLEVLPFFHIYGINVLLNEMLFLGATQVTMMRFELVRFLELIQNHKVTVMNVAPPILVGMMRHPDIVSKYDLSSMKTVYCAAAPLSAEVQKRSEKLFPNGHVLQGYGMTEASPVALVTNSGRYGDVGVPLSDTEMRIVKVSSEQQSGSDTSSGEDVEPGEEGEVWLRGPQIMKGYLNPEDNVNVMVGDWYRTGDIGKTDADGFLFITDRLKELIKYKGYQVPPAELEGILLTHPWVADAIVIGVPDADDVSFERPRALLLLRDTVTEKQKEEAEKNIDSFVSDRVLPYKRLSGGIRFVDSIPKNASGKLLRRQARTEELEYLKQNPLRRKLKSTEM